MATRTLGRAAAATSLLILTACLFASRKPAGAASGSRDGRVRVNVTNNYALPVDVSAVASGTVYRMGTVAPGIVGHFLLRRAMLAGGGMVEFVAQPVGTEPPVRSGQLLLEQGDIVDFEITTHLIASYARVRP